MKCTTGIMAALLCAVVVLGGCDSGDDNDVTIPPPVQPAGNPPPPAIGLTQIDRMGRAVINTANTDPFFREAIAREKNRHDLIGDDYNIETDQSLWVPRFSPIIESNLGIIDSLDGVCGNQILAGALGPRRYKPLADVLADDQLYVNTASGTCRQYLAVEANAIGVANNDCGGRTPNEDIIETSYSVLATGRLTGVTSGVVPPDTDGPTLPNHSDTVFPFLGQPVR